jgi:hypothetical protein
MGRFLVHDATARASEFWMDWRQESNENIENIENNENCSNEIGVE